MDTHADADIVSYRMVEDAEPLQRYRPGGYHPVNIGDRLNDRYEVIHKLGFGSYSTVWLASDATTRTNVAVKICTADSDRPAESRILALLQRSGGQTDEARHDMRCAISLPCDTFEVQGPNGLHHCLVLEPARISLAEAREASYVRVFQLSTARTIAAQLVQTVAFLHGEGIVHGGRSALSLRSRKGATTDAVSRSPRGKRAAMHASHRPGGAQRGGLREVRRTGTRAD